MVMSRTIFATFMMVIMAMSLLGCEDKLDPIDAGGNQGDGLPDTVTYTEHTRLLLDTNCSICHSSQLSGANRQGAPPGVDTDSFAAAVASSQRCNIRIQAGTMPPAGPLSTYNRQLYQKWIDQGMQE